MMYRILVNIFSIPTTWLITSLLGWVLIFMAFDALATGKDNTINNYYTTNNYYETNESDPVATNTTTVVESTTITSGISSSELSRGIATAGATNHQFDYSTLDFQASVVGGFYDDESAVSFGIGKRFKQVDALWHGSFTENGSRQLITFGATFRF